MTLDTIKATVVSLALVVALGACASAPRGERVYARVAPPPPRVEAVAVAPGPQYVWLGGHYRWNGRAYNWVSGQWERARPGYHAWVPGHWSQSRRGWYWVDGKWR